MSPPKCKYENSVMILTKIEDLQTKQSKPFWIEVANGEICRIVSEDGKEDYDIKEVEEE